MHIWEPTPYAYYSDSVRAEYALGHKYNRLEVCLDEEGWHALLLMDEDDELVLIDEDVFDNLDDAKTWAQRADGVMPDGDDADYDDAAFWEMMLRDVADDDNPFK